MSILAPFQGRRGAGQSLTSSGASQSVSIDPAAKSVRIVNTGTTNPAYFSVGKGSLTASATDSILMPGQAIIVTKGDGDDTFAYLQSAGTTTIHIQTGEGGI